MSWNHFCPYDFFSHPKLNDITKKSRKEDYYRDAWCRRCNEKSRGQVHTSLRRSHSTHNELKLGKKCNLTFVFGWLVVTRLSQRLKSTFFEIFENGPEFPFRHIVRLPEFSLVCESLTNTYTTLITGKRVKPKIITLKACEIWKDI